MNKKPPPAFLLHGYIACGKTTLARQLEMYHTAVRFTPDDWMVRLYGQDPPEEHFQEYLLAVKGIMEENWIRLLKLGIPVVLDYGFWKRAERDHVRQAVLQSGGRPLLFSFQCRESVALDRARERNKNGPDQLYIADNTYEVLKARFEPLQPDEERITLFMG